MTDYKHVSCMSYERFELAIMHGEKLHLTWDDANVVYDQVVTPLDLCARAGEEFLRFRAADGRAGEVRLDRIRRATPA